MRKRPASNRRLVVLASVVAVATLAVPLGAWAVDPAFNDVPESHPFFAEIEWMQSVGITEGYPDGGYHPGAPVTRQAMSAFMQRLYDLQEETVFASSGGSQTIAFTTFTPLTGATVSIEVPPGAQARISARFSGESSCRSPGGTAASCRLRIMRQVGSDFTIELEPETTDFAFDSNDSGTAPSGTGESHSITRHDLVGRGGTYTYRVEVMSTSSANFFTLDDWTFEVESDLLLSSDSVPPF